MSDAWQHAYEANARSRSEFKRPTADIHADFENGVALSMDGDRKRLTPEERCALPGAAKSLPERDARAMHEAMREIDPAADFAVDELRNAPTHYRSAHTADCGHATFDENCANCHLQPTCCARRMSPMPDGTVWCDTCGRKRIVRDGRESANVPPPVEIRAFVPIDPGLWIRDIDGSWRAPPADSILLTGAQAEQYKRLMAAAAEAAVVTARMKATSEALRDAFQQFCAGVAPYKEP